MKPLKYMSKFVYIVDFHNSMAKYPIFQLVFETAFFWDFCYYLKIQCGNVTESESLVANTSSAFALANMKE